MISFSDVLLGLSIVFGFPLMYLWILLWLRIGEWSRRWF